MDTIFLVTRGSYSDYSVCAAFTTREKAQEFIDKWEAQKAAGKCLYTDFNDIETYSLDGEWRPDEHTCEMLRDGTVHSYKVGPSTLHQRGSGLIGNKNFPPRRLSFVTYGDKTMEQVVKAANEMRVQLIAMNQWPEERG